MQRNFAIKKLSIFKYIKYIYDTFNLNFPSFFHIGGIQKRLKRTKYVLLCVAEKKTSAMERGQGSDQYACLSLWLCWVYTKQLIGFAFLTPVFFSATFYKMTISWRFLRICTTQACLLLSISSFLGFDISSCT